MTMRHIQRRRRSGYILVQTLVVIMALVALMAIMAADQHSSMVETDNGLDERRAEMAVDAAVARAEASLGAANPNLVTASDTWTQVGQNGISPTASTGVQPAEYQLYDESMPSDSAPTFRMQILDAASLINLNEPAILATSGISAGTQTTMLTGIQQQWLDLGLTQQQIDCLLDWEQTGETARSDGAKDSFYNGLQQPYNATLGAMSTVDESLLVDNWTGQTLYQAQQSSSTSTPLPTDSLGNTLPIASLVTVDSGAPNTQASGTARIRITSNRVAQQLGLPIPRNGNSPAVNATSFTQLFGQGGMNPQAEQNVLNQVTFTTSTRLAGKINLNTAPQAVLQTVPGVTQAIASAIVAQQSAGFQTFGQLATVNGITPGVLAQCADYFSVGSDTWIVRAYGHSGNTGVAVEAVIRVTNSAPQIITWDRINTTTVPTWWDWQDATATVDASQTN